VLANSPFAGVEIFDFISSPYDASIGNSSGRSIIIQKVNP
jgi:hypothetical protein